MDALFTSLAQLQSALDQAEIGSALIGGVAVAVWGEPRLTRDVDVKVAISREEASRLLSLLSSDYESAYGKPEEVAHQMGMIFLRDALGTRIDLLLADMPFDRMAIQRARNVTVAPEVVARLCTPEDLIIYKMLSTRPRDLEDVKGIVRRQGVALDRPYLLKWLRDFEMALDDSTLVATFQRLDRIP